MNTTIQTLILIGSLGAMMWGMLKFMLRDIHKELSSILNRLDRMDEKHDKAEARIDHLYQICIELLQTRK